MSIINVITITVDETAVNADRDLIAETGYRELAGSKLVDYSKRIVAGQGKPVVRTEVGAVKASGTLTGDTVIATDAVVINGVTLTAHASTASQTQFVIGVDDDATMANLAACINANTDLAGIVTATSAAAVVTVTAARAGLIGNAITLVSNDATITASAGRLADGVDGTSDVTHYYGSGA